MPSLSHPVCWLVLSWWREDGAGLFLASSSGQASGHEMGCFIRFLSFQITFAIGLHFLHGVCRSPHVFALFQ